MINNLNNFINDFIKIEQMGFVKLVNNHNSGIGLTFEKLLGKDIENFSYADFNGIEIKTKNINSKMPISLFKLSPEGKDFFESKRLWEEYAYFNDFKNHKQLYCKTYVNKLKKVGNNYFSLNINNEKKIIELFIYDKNKNIIEKESFWDFEKIKAVLYRKLEYLAYIKAETKTINKEKYYHYTKLTLLKLISFERFLEMLEKNKIFILFSMDVFKSGVRKGQFHDHGTGFCIYECDLETLFLKIDSCLGTET